MEIEQNTSPDPERIASDRAIHDLVEFRMLAEDLQVDFRQDSCVGSERGRDVLVADQELDGSLE